MATLEELLAEYGLSETPQTKVASEQKPEKDEVEQVLESLGLSGAEEGVEKVANTNDTKGDRMSLTGIYEEFFGESAPEAGQEKVASDEMSGEYNEATQLFGELTAHYFEAGVGQYFEKIAAGLEEEAGAGEQPMAQLGGHSSLGATMGSQKDPHMPVNHAASGGAPMKAMTGNESQYSLKEMALKKQILKRMLAAPVGDIEE